MVYDVGRVMHSARGARWCGCAVARAIRCGSASAPGTVVAFSTLHSEESLNARVVFPDDLHSVHYSGVPGWGAQILAHFLAPDPGPHF